MKQAGALALETLFGVVEQKIGPVAMKIAKEALKEVFQAASETLQQRIDGFTIPDISEQLMDIASEIQRWLGVTIVIRLDGGERMSPNDAALLSVLAETAREGVNIVVALSDADKQGQDLLAKLISRGVRQLVLRPIPAASVDRWLQSAKIPASQWTMIMQVSRGYPLFIERAIALSLENADLRGLTAGGHSADLLDAAWGQLSLELQTAAKKLSVFADPPDETFLAEYMGIEMVHLETIRNALYRVKMFVTADNDLLWFHDRRRNHIWNQILTDKERRTLATEPIEAMKIWLEANEGVDMWICASISDLIRAAPVEASDQHLRNLLALDRDELAILWALIEVVDPSAIFELMASTSDVVEWAILRAGNIDDPLDSLDRLRELGFIGGAANSALSLTALVTPSAFVLAAIVGEIGRAFASYPLQRLMSRALDTFVRPLMPFFRSASVSLGQRGIEGHREAMREAQKTDVDGRTAAELPGLGFALGVEGMPLEAAVFFDSQEGRDVALDGLMQHVFPPRVSLGVVFTLPPERVRWWLIADALKAGVSTRDIDFTSPDQLLEILAQTASAEEAIRSLIPSTEAHALGLASPHRYLVDINPSLNAWVVLEVLGGERRTVEYFPSALWPALINDPLRDLRLRRAGCLGNAERIGMIHAHSGFGSSMQHPLLGLADTIEKRGRRFNQGLAPFVLPQNPGELRESLQTGFQTSRKLLAALHDGRSDAVNASLYVGIDRSRERVFDVESWFATALVVEDGQSNVCVFDGPFEEPSPLSGLSAHQAADWGIGDPSKVRQWSSGDAASVVGGFIGFEHSDVSVPWLLG
ncbi:hypothetical protein [Sanguibacter sp. 25GB23B1]|uniref:hypothetical protein n=1 Tax=unclassified Sanguibacter TaxID=2645534 RepID=UPI0032AFDE5E